MADSKTKSIGLENEEIVYREDGQIVWKMTPGEIALMGEYTTLDGGPTGDIYYLVFLSNKDEEWRTAAYHSAEADFLSGLGEKLGAKLTAGGLDMSAYGSRVIWPANLEGEAMFEIVPKGARGLWEFFRRSLFQGE